MAPGGQRTFSLIPTTLVDNSRDPRPMTSKAAKKAYQKANRGPKVTRAEQRLLDAEEQDRIKKEFEREKTAVKAKAAREKKAEKEHAARQERKRLGIPEPSKFVRPSQPTISRFVRGDGGKRKWQDADSIGEDSEGTIADEDTSGGQPPPAKRLAIIAEDEEGEDTYQEQKPESRKISKEGEGSMVPQDAESEGEFGEFPSLSQPGLLEDIESPMLPKSTALLGISSFRREVPRESEPELPARRTTDEDYLFDSSQQLFNMASAQLLSEEAEAVAKSDGIEPVLSSSFESKNLPGILSARPQNQRVSAPPHMSNSKTSKVPLKPAMPDQQFKVPRPLPCKSVETKATAFVYPPPTYEATARKSIAPSTNKEPNLPPSSTQAFLEDNLGDFLPSTSQEMRELLEDIDELEIPSNTQIAREISPIKTRTDSKSQAPTYEENYDDLVCTQDLILSSQDMREISPIKAKPVQPPISKTVPPRIPSKYSKAIQQPAFKQALDESIFDEFPSTQDLILTPQDLEEIEAPTQGAPTINNLKSHMILLLGEPQKPKRGRPPKVAKKPTHPTIELPQIGNHPSQKKTSKPPKDPGKPQPASRERRRFFEEKEMDQVNAALHESKNMTRTTAPPQQLNGQEKRQANAARTLPQAPTPEPRTTTTRRRAPPNLKQEKRFFEEKDNDLVQAAIQESKLMAAAQQKEPPSTTTSQIKRNSLKGDNTSTTRGKRSLQRVQSVATDYGDDELTEQDLLGLC